MRDRCFTLAATAGLILFAVPAGAFIDHRIRFGRWPH